MTQLSKADEALEALQKVLEQEKESGPGDTTWSDDLPSDPLPEHEEDVSVTFIEKDKG